MTNSKGHGGLGNALIYFCGIGLAVSSMVKFLHPVKAVAYMRYLGYEHETLFLIAGVELLTAVLLLLRVLSAGLCNANCDNGFWGLIGELGFH
jgi:hypothetical protein